MNCVKCFHTMCNWRLRVVGYDDKVRISRFDKKYMCGGLNRTRDKHATCLWIAKNVSSSFIIR